MVRGSVARAAALATVLVLVGAACSDSPSTEGQQPTGGATTEPPAGGGQPQGGLLDEVLGRGTLRCGVNQTVPGFGFLTPDGNIEGFDIDFCRAFAAALFGDPEAHELVPVTAEERFNALRAGQFDVLVRNTTWTSSRDGAEGLTFAHANYYDGQGMMVPVDSGFTEVADMDNTVICSLSGTTTELNLADYFQGLGITQEVLTFEENGPLQEAFIAGQCDGWTSDRSQLAGNRSQFPEEAGGPESLVILDDVMSKEPLAPAVLDGDAEWFDVINLTVNGLILAEELGVTSENVSAQASTPDEPQIANLLGVAFEGGEPSNPGIGVEATFMQDVLTAVGNYGEIFERHLAPIGLERGINALWTDGGIQYAIPFR